MKKLLMALVVAGAFTTANAQEATKVAEPAKPQLSKEEKEKLKQKQEEELNAAFKEAGLTESEIKQCKEVMETARLKRGEIKKSSATEEEKTKKTQEVKDEEKSKLKEIMGKDKFKLYSEAKKKQKEAAGTAN